MESLIVLAPICVNTYDIHSQMALARSKAYALFYSVATRYFWV